MARKYDWEAHLTPQEQVSLCVYDSNMAPARDTIRIYQEAKDAIRRKAVQRARNAILKQIRQAKKGETA